MSERLTERLENGGVRFSNGEYWNTVYPQNDSCLTDVHRMAVKLCDLEDLMDCKRVEIKDGKILVPLTEEELRHLANDTIAYIWKMEETNRDKEEFGYFSRKELKKKLDWFLKQFEKPCGFCAEKEK